MNVARGRQNGSRVDTNSSLGKATEINSQCL